MTNYIELNRDEREAAVSMLRVTASDDYGYGFGTALDEVVAAINMVRQGDVTGTIRRFGSDYAVRRSFGWLVIRSSYVEEHKGTLDPEVWELLHVPEGS